MTPTVHVMQGLSAAGKTTAARKLIANSVRPVRYVGIDPLRQMLDGHTRAVPWEPAAEASMQRVQAVLVRQLVVDGWDVVVDGTHAYPGQVADLRAAVAGVPVRWVVHAVPTALEVCLARDAVRTDPVGELEIRALHARWVAATAAGWVLTPEWLAGAGSTGRLYPRHAKVLAAAADGASLSEVGRRLGMPRGQVSARLSEAYRALDVTWAPQGERRTKAVRVARRAGLIPAAVVGAAVSAVGASGAPGPRPSAAGGSGGDGAGFNGGRKASSRSKDSRSDPRKAENAQNGS